MKIWIAKIPVDGMTYEGEEPTSILGMNDESLVRLKQPIQYELKAVRVSDELIVSGSLSVDVELKCTRCSEFFSTTVRDSDFLRAYSASKGIDSVDITEDIREAFLLSCPDFPVCNEDCNGLCAQCGANLNVNPCNCAGGDRPNPWSALDHLNL